MEPNTNSQPKLIVQPLALELIVEEGVACPIEGALRFDPSDPYAVTFAMDVKESPISWIFARDLLVHGICEPAGDGDVHVWPGLTDRGRVVLLIELCASEESVVVAADPSCISAFVTKSLEMVPLGAESDSVDIDAFLAEIFTEVSKDRSDG